MYLGHYCFWRGWIRVVSVLIVWKRSLYKKLVEMASVIARNLKTS